MDELSDNDPTLEEDLRALLRYMARACIYDPAELERHYQEIDEMIAKLNEPEEATES